MADERELIEGEEMVLLNTITDACTTCHKKSFHNVVYCDPKNQNLPDLSMFQASNLDVTLFRRTVPRKVEILNTETNQPEIQTVHDQFFVFFKCDDPMCLLGHLRESMFFNWTHNHQAQFEREMRQRAIAQEIKRRGGKTSRRANRRKRGKAKEKKS